MGEQTLYEGIDHSFAATLTTTDEYDAGHRVAVAG